MVGHIVLIVIILSIICLLISENHNPTKTLSWILILVFLPVVGLVLYFILGKDYRRKRLVSNDELHTLLSLRNPQHDIPPSQLSNPSLAGLAQMLDSANSAPLQSGNKVDIYTNFADMFHRLLLDIESASKSIHILFFKIEDDAVGQQLANLLIEKVRQGVEVRLLFDDAGNFHVKRRFYKQLRDGGVQVVAFLKIWDSLWNREVNCRNHRKIVVIDGKVGYTGGMNVAQRYMDGIPSGIWRDTHIRIYGPSVAQLQIAFLADWRFATSQLLTDPHYFATDVTSGNSLSQIVTAGPMDRWQTVTQAMLYIIAMSRHYIYLQSPYFMPTDPLLMALRNAALAGVDVRLMIPSKGDKGKLVQWASHSYLADVLDAGVKVFFYTKGYMHAKTIVCDDSFTTIGSTNLDVRSLEQDFEINAMLYDANLARQMKDIFLADANDCSLLDAQQWAERPLSIRFRDSLARLFSPLL